MRFREAGKDNTSLQLVVLVLKGVFFTPSLTSTGTLRGQNDGVHGLLRRGAGKAGGRELLSGPSFLVYFQCQIVSPTQQGPRDLPFS